MWGVVGMADPRVALALRELLVYEGDSSNAVVALSQVQRELWRRHEDAQGSGVEAAETAAQCVVCLEAVTCSEMTCMSCDCESLYHYDCLSHANLQAPEGGPDALRCPTCRAVVSRRRVSVHLLELATRRRRTWSDAALPELAHLLRPEQQVLKDGEESNPHQELYRLRAQVHRLASLPSVQQHAPADSSAATECVGDLALELPRVALYQLQALEAVGRGFAPRAASRGPGLCCGLCFGPLATFSDLWSQGCLRCSVDTSLQTFYHRECLSWKLLKLPTTAPICVTCGDGAVRVHSFGVKRRLAELTQDLRRPVTAQEVLNTVRAMCRAVADETARLLEVQAEVADKVETRSVRSLDRSRSPPRLSMVPLRDPLPR